MGRLLMASRDDLVTALSARYGASPRSERGRILDEFVAVTGVHRKHLMKLLRAGRSSRGNGPRLGRRLYDAAMREALVVLWEASDRICSKRLRPMIPILLEAMERHGHLGPASEIRAGLLVMSAATIDRSLREVWDLAGGRSRRRTAPSKALRRGIPVRTFADWHDPALGLVEADLVAHSGPTSRGSFLQTLTLIDVATGWTEYAPVLAREQQLLTEVLGEMRKLMPFPLLDFDTDNDSVFMNETVKAYCQDCGITFTRCRPYKKNDQAFVVRKNGAVVRRIVGYRRFEGLDAAAGLAGTIGNSVFGRRVAHQAAPGALAEDDGELGLGHDPLTRAHLPRLLGAVQASSFSAASFGKWPRARTARRSVAFKASRRIRRVARERVERTTSLQARRQLWPRPGTSGPTRSPRRQPRPSRRLWRRTRDRCP